MKLKISDTVSSPASPLGFDFPIFSEVGAGNFGVWMKDSNGLPCYRLRKEVLGTKDVWHLVGNERIKATAHSGGYVQVYSWDTGPQILNYYEPEKGYYSGGYSIIILDGKPYVTLTELRSDDTNFGITFGCGYVKKTLNLGGKLYVEESVDAPEGNLSFLVHKVRTINVSSEHIALWFLPVWQVNWYPLDPALIMTSPFDKFWHLLRKIRGNRIKSRYKLEILSDAISLKYASKGSLERPSWKVIPVSEIYYRVESMKKPCRVFASQRDLLEFLYERFDTEKEIEKFYNLFSEDMSIFSFAFQETFSPDECKVISTKFGYSIDNDFEDSSEIGQFSKKQSYLYFFSPEINRPITRELLWHSYYLQAGSQFSKVYKRFFVDQGSAYSYLHGASGAPRDWAFFIIPLIYLKPQLAREMLLFIANLQSSQTGRIPYAIVGNGKPTGAGVHSFSSDLDLFFIWAVLEYLGATFDWSLLSAEVPFIDSKEEKTFLQHIRLSFYHLKEKVGVGKHGLIRVGSGDWNDPLLAYSSNPLKTFFLGESTFNSLLTLYVLPQFASMIEKYDLEFAKELNEFAKEIRKNISKTWNGKWFVRGFTGKRDEILGGVDSLFLDVQPFGILLNIISNEEKKVLLQVIYESCIKDEPFGARCLHPPMEGRFLEIGSDTNGGIWHAINAWLTWAWAKIDPASAWEFLQKTTLFAHAEAYPDIWYGIWSGPDAYNSSLSKTPGQTFNLNFTPMTEFPIMNMNCHAGILFSIIKFLFEPTSEGLVISPLGLFKNFEFSSYLVDLVKKEKQIMINYKPICEGTGKFLIKIPSELVHLTQFQIEDEKNIAEKKTVLDDNLLFVELKLKPYFPIRMCIEL